jgi:hypothetical protein
VNHKNRNLEKAARKVAFVFRIDFTENGRATRAGKKLVVEATALWSAAIYRRF